MLVFTSSLLQPWLATIFFLDCFMMSFDILGCDKPRRPNSSYCSASCCDSAAEVLLKRVMGKWCHSLPQLTFCNLLVDAPVLSEAEESELAELLAEEAELNEKVFAAQVCSWGSNRCYCLQKGYPNFHRKRSRSSGYLLKGMGCMEVN